LLAIVAQQGQYGDDDSLVEYHCPGLQSNTASCHPPPLDLELHWSQRKDESLIALLNPLGLSCGGLLSRVGTGMAANTRVALIGIMKTDQVELPASLIGTKDAEPT
jgi:hypothetical protein